MASMRRLKSQRSTLDYDTSRALKDAGYPQAMEQGDACYLGACEQTVVARREMDGEDTVYILYRDVLEYRLHSATDAWVKCPDLAELIAACEGVRGYHLFCLEHPHEGWLATMADDHASSPLEPYASSGYRPMPETAVASVWLELQAGTEMKQHERPFHSRRRQAQGSSRGRG